MAGSGRSPSSDSIVRIASMSRDLIEARQRADHRSNLVARALVEPGKRLLAFSREREKTLPAIRFGGLAADQSAPLEFPQEPTQIARIEPQLGREGGRRGGLGVSQLEEDSHFGERERALQQPLMQHADRLRIEAIETPHGVDARFHGGFQ